ncbi:MAG: U32 family peptidase [Methanopyri archaeon]|nr:U32 family peptidase [Methanopyri archaeon]
MATVELLAPASDLETVGLAVDAGADAVYVGARRFNARQRASRLDMPGLRRAITLCHEADVRVHVPVNILVRDTELGKAVELCGELYAAGADALILQDLGLASLAKETVSDDCELHASTQCNVQSTATACELAGRGFARVILARELSLDEVRTIVRDAAPLGIELFAHGALCFSYSGLCQMSGFIGKRSGNRGLCAQPCRFDYRIAGAGRSRGPMPLSMRELRTIARLDDVLAAGPRALKIEGRSRSGAYVHTATRVYRRLIDQYSETGVARPTEEELRELAVVFTRGFTNGRLLGDGNRKVLAPDRGISCGLPVGHVVSVDERARTATVRFAREAHVGDTLAVHEPRGRLLVRHTLGRKARAGDAQRIPLKDRPQGLVGKEVFVSSTHSIDQALEDARERARMDLPREPSLEREGRPLPRIKLPAKRHDAAKDGAPLLRAHLPWGASPDDHLAAGADQIILPVPPRADDMLDAWLSDRVVLWFPPYMEDAHHLLVEGAVDVYRKVVSGFMAGDLGTLTLLSNLLADEPEKVLGDHWLNIFNAHTLKDVARYTPRICLSQELTLHQAGFIAARRPPTVTELEIVAGGNQQAMVTANCVRDGVVGDCIQDQGLCHRTFELEDRTGHRFPARTDPFCRTHIFNAHPLVAHDRIDAFRDAGVDVLRLDLRGMWRKDGINLLKAYRKVLDGDQVPPPRPNTFTRGHLFKPVQ